MNERQQAHIDYFPERIEYWKGCKRDRWAVRMLAARHADHAENIEALNRSSRVKWTSAALEAVMPAAGIIVGEEESDNLM